MRFIINKNIQYNPVDGTLYCPENHVDTITLMRVANELLMLFIQNNGTPLARDFILNELWVKKGLNASSNNLNNYVSILRKALQKCGQDNLITTIPKHGFLFEGDIEQLEVLKKEEDKNGEVEKIEDVSSPEDRKVNKVGLKPLLFGGGGVIILFALMWIFYKNDNLLFQRTLLYKAGNCHVYLMDDRTRTLEKDTVIRNVDAIIKNEELNCKVNANVYYFSDRKVNAHNKRKVNDLLAYCVYEGHVPCDNYFMSKYEDES